MRCNKKVYHYIPKGSIEEESIQLQDESIYFASTFNGFCNTHDRELFAVIEGSNEIVYSIQQMYAMVYRNFYYMLLKKEITQSIIIKNSIRSTPKYYQKDFKPRNSHDAQIAVDLILDLKKNQVMREELFEVISDIESNYDEKNHTWDIINNCMTFSTVRTLKVTNAYLCFQTVREYLQESEVSVKQYNTIYSYSIKRYNHVSTIVLPNVVKSEINVLFAISNKHQTDSPKDFITYVNSCSNEELINILNNIIIDAYEELYFSKSCMYDSLCPEFKKQICDVLLKQMSFNSVPLSIDDVYKAPKIRLLQLKL